MREMAKGSVEWLTVASNDIVLDEITLYDVECRSVAATSRV